MDSVNFRRTQAAIIGAIIEKYSRGEITYNVFMNLNRKHILSEDVIYRLSKRPEYKNLLDTGDFWNIVLQTQHFSEAFIRNLIIEYGENFLPFEWLSIVKSQHGLSENFLREFHTRLGLTNIFRYQQVSEEFLHDFFQDKYLATVISYQHLSENFLRTHVNKFDAKILYNHVFTTVWHIIAQKQLLSEEFIRDFAEKLGWGTISKYQVLSEQFIEENSQHVKWNIISESQILSEDFISKNSQKVNWLNIFRSQHLSEPFIVRNFREIYRPQILKYQKLSENFLEKWHWGSRDWQIICQYQVLSEKFIDSHSQEVNWQIICQYQVLSEKFIDSHSQEVNWNIICQYQTLSEKFIEHQQYYIWPSAWKEIYMYQQVSDEFMIKHAGKYIQSWVHDNVYVDPVIRTANAWYCLIHRRILSEDFLLTIQDMLGENYTSPQSDKFSSKFIDMFGLCKSIQIFSLRFLQEQHMDIMTYLFYR